MGPTTGEDDTRVASVVLNEADADPVALERSTAGLRRDLLSLDVESVRWGGAGAPPPPGARGVDPVVASGLVLTVGTSAKLLKDVILALATWRKARPSRTVEVTVGGASIRLEGPETQRQDELVKDFLRSVEEK